MRRTFATIVVILVTACGTSSDISEVSPEPVAFTNAHAKIVGDSDGVYYGNSEAAEQMAEKYAEEIKPLIAKAFAEGKESEFSLSGGKFRTFCQVNDNSVAFLVRTEIRQYKGDVRDGLLKIAWLLAINTTASHPDADNLEIEVGLKGTLFYGATAVGERFGEPTCGHCR